MKKSAPQKLALRPQTLRVLTGEDRSRVAGGGDVVNGFIMKDTIIIRTGGFAAPTLDGR